MAKTFVPHRENDARMPLGDASRGPRSARNINGPLYGGKAPRTRNARPGRRAPRPKPATSTLVQGNPTTAI